MVGEALTPVLRVPWPHSLTKREETQTSGGFLGLFNPFGDGEASKALRDRRQSTPSDAADLGPTQLGADELAFLARSEGPRQ